MKTSRDILQLTKQAYIRQGFANPKEAVGPLPLHLQGLSQLHLFQNPGTKIAFGTTQFPANTLSPQAFATGYVWSLSVEA